MSYKEERLLRIIQSMVLSEKATRLRESQNAITLCVVRDATKPEIKAAVEYLFSTKVSGVQTTITPGKRKQTRKGIGKRSDVKKAYVKLLEPIPSNSMLALVDGGGV